MSIKTTSPYSSPTLLLPASIASSSCFGQLFTNGSSFNQEKSSLGNRIYETLHQNYRTSQNNPASCKIFKKFHFFALLDLSQNHNSNLPLLENSTENLTTGHTKLRSGLSFLLLPVLSLCWNALAR